MPKPTTDTVDEPSLHGVTKQQVAVEPELRMTSVQVCEPATMSVTRDKAAASAITERSSTHCNMAEALHLCDGLAAGLPFSISSIRSSGSTMTPSSLLSTVAGSPLAPLGSLILLTLPWPGVDYPAPRDSTPPALPRPSGSVRLLHPFGSTLVICHSSSTAGTSGFSVTCSATVNSSSLLSSPWLLLFPPRLLSLSSLPRTLLIVLLPEISPPPKFPPMPSSVVVYSPRT
ncbi:Speckle targeted PIP5K1A-regulated poly(A) polymerase [Labeo rohita]|uniref:Speckle targeted PIP5K1A-regulated poly(A) polymerase n=1 Tax=Labeo rohita TaxID=84645 RepID=A0ABQ8LES7_LABRO|nr:Speckle targeted PIP5K1A-regulated poly(A) polymerase [Labeo rohita]